MINGLPYVFPLFFPNSQPMQEFMYLTIRMSKGFRKGWCIGGLENEI
jgi:hypothetical protein